MHYLPIITVNGGRLHIRHANNIDAPKVRTIIFDTLRSYGLPADSEDTDYDLYDIEKYYGQDRFWVIINSEGEIKGCFALFHVDENTAELRKMYFDPSIRGKGVGDWAMSFILNQGQYLGYQTLTLETASVLVEAINLYKKHGFLESCNDAHSGRCDVVMSREI